MQFYRVSVKFSGKRVLFYPKSPTLTLEAHQCLWYCCRFDADCAAGPRPEIQDQHPGPLSRISPVSFRSSYWHRQRDAASLQVGCFFLFIFFFFSRNQHKILAANSTRKVRAVIGSKCNISKRAPSNQTVSRSCGAQSQWHRCVMCYKVTANVNSLLRHTGVSEECRCAVGAGFFPARFPSFCATCVLQTSGCTTAAAAGLKITFFARIISCKVVSVRRSDPQAATRFWKYLYLFICRRHNSKLFLSLFLFCDFFKSPLFVIHEY